MTDRLEKAMFPRVIAMATLIKADADSTDDWKLLLLSAKHRAGSISLTPHNHPTGRPSYFSHFPEEEFCPKPQGQ